MSPLHRLARKASRRLTLARFIRTLAVALPLCLAVAALAILTGRLLGSAFPWWWAAAPAAAIALITATTVAWRARPTTIAAAAELDAALKLKDRLGSALALEPQSKQDAFASITVDEATALANKVRVERAIPIRPDHSWWWWVAAAAACVGIGIFVPPLRTAAQKAAEQAAFQKTAEKQKADEALIEAEKKLDELLEATDPEQGDFAMGDHQTLLDDLRKQIEAGVKEPDEAAAEAAKLMEQTASQMEQKAADALAEQNAAQDLAAEAADQLAKEPGAEEVEKLIEAMKSGDPEAALKAAEELEKAAENMTEEQRNAAAERLEAFAKAMENQAAAAQQEAQKQAQQTQKDLQQQGMSSESAQKLAQQAAEGASAEQLQQQMQQQGMSQDAARNAAQQLQQQAQQQRSLQKASERCKNCSNGMQQGAENLRQGNGNPNNNTEGNASGKQGGQGGNNGLPSDFPEPSNQQGKGSGAGDQKTGKPIPAGGQSDAQNQQPSTGAGRGTALHNLKQELTGAVKRNNQARRLQQQAQEIRVTKQDLLRNIADKQIKQQLQWAEQEAAEGQFDKNWRYNDDTVDAKQTGDDGVVVSQQIRSGDTASPYDPTAISRRQLRSDLSTAMETAERAIEERNIPSRYSSVVQRYFQKTMQRTAPDAPPPAPAPDAPEASPSSSK